MNKLTSQFVAYLENTRHVSKVTSKNYLSDLRFFTSWLSHSSGTNLNLLDGVNEQSLGKYKQFLLSKKSAKSTTNRRLASLRVFCQFCYVSNLLTKSYAQMISSLPEIKSTDNKIHDLVSKFGKYLKNQRSSRNTIKNYTADVKKYLDFVIEQK